jgi:hypothetical protein
MSLGIESKETYPVISLRVYGMLAALTGFW